MGGLEMGYALGNGIALIRFAVLMFAAVCIGSCGGGGGGGGDATAAGRLFVADSGNAAVASISNLNPAPGTSPNERVIRGTSNNGIGPGSIPALLLDAARDQLYVTNQISIVIFNNAGTANGAIGASRMLTSAGGGFNSMSMDSARDHLYVGNISGGVQVFHNASTASETGPLNQPNRTITFPGTNLIRDIALDSSRDILYVAAVDNSGPSMSIFVFDGASALNSNISGNVTPNRTITIATSTFGTMGLAVDPAHDRLFIADSSDDVYAIESAHSKIGAPAPPDRTIVLPSIVTRLAVDAANDRLYAAGNTVALYIVPGISTASGIIAATGILPSATGNFSAVAVRP
jgi:hypothetical protein